MRVRRFVWLMSFLLGWLICGCSGGSGSSGFDNFPNSENAAIQTALTEQQCVVFNGLSICPVDTAAAIPTPIATATATSIVIGPTPARTPQPATTTSPTPSSTPTASPQPHQPRVDTGITAGPVPCTAVDATNTCVFLVPFAPDGFPSGTVFRVAVRTTEPDSAWSIVVDLTATGAPNAPAFDAPVAVDEAPQPPDTSLHIQLAILAWITPPTSIPATVQTLAESGAAYAFVTMDLSVQPGT